MKAPWLVFAMVAPLFAQAPGAGPKLAYEVATIKLNTSGDGRMMIGGIGPGASGGRFHVTNLPLRQLIVLAYADRSQGPPAPGGQDFSVTGGPGWISTDRYDIDARPEEGFIPTVEQSQKMLQALLEERFRLKVRRETKDGPIYALVVAKDGPKVKKSADQTPVTFNAPPPGGGPGGPPPPPGGPGPAIRAGGPGGAPPGAPPLGGNPMSGPMPRGMMMMGLGQLRASAQTMAGFAWPDRAQGVGQDQLNRPL